MNAQVINFTATVVALTGPNRISARKARALAGKLMRDAPGDLTPAEREALEALIAAAARCDSAVIAQIKQGPVGTRDARNGTSRAWTALGLALQASMLVPRFAEVAKRIHDALFGDDVSLVDLDALSMWGQSFRLLTRIDGEGFAAQLDAMGLGVFVEQARAATSTLGEITGANGTPAAAPEPAEIEVAEAHEHFNVALSRYARVLAASVDERRPESIRRFVSALEALDAMKKSVGGDRDDDVTEPTEPGTPMPVNGSPSPVLRSE